MIGYWISYYVTLIALTVIMEAGGEPLLGQQMVAGGLSTGREPSIL